MLKKTLNNGVEIPIFGFCVYLINDLDERERKTLHALEAGYRLIDTAAAYQNKEFVEKVCSLII